MKMWMKMTWHIYIKKIIYRENKAKTPASNYINKGIVQTTTTVQNFSSFNNRVLLITCEYASRTLV